jgi:hypothetical protein
MAKFEHILPSLHKDQRLEPIVARGRWEKVGSFEYLRNVAISLDVVKSASRVEYLVSIPDTWARAEVVRSALFDDKHILHESIRLEWRCMLTLIALSALSPTYSLTARPIILRDLASRPFSSSADIDEHRGRNFADVLSDMKPENGDVLAHGLDWENLSLLGVNGQPVALAVPTVLVVPRRELAQDLDGVVPWCKGGEILDPIKSKILQPEELAVLGRYLTFLIDEVKGVNSENLDLIQLVQSNLESFRNECVAALADRMEPQGLDFAFERTAGALTGLPNHRVYNALATAWRISAGQAERHDVLLQPRDEFAQHTKGVILLDPNIEKTLDRPPNEIRIWKLLSLARLEVDDALWHQSVAEMSNEGYIGLTPDEIFTEKLCKIDGGTISAHGTGELRNHLLPISPIVLLFVSPSEIAQNISIKELEDSSVVTFSLPVSRSDGTTYRHAVSRTYRSEDIVSRDVSAVAASFWPNFDRSDWHWNFFFYLGDLQFNIVPRILFGVKSVSRYLADKNTQDNKIVSARRLIDAGEELSDRLGLLETQFVHELHLLDAPVEAVFCDAVLDRVPEDYVAPRDRTTVGFFLPPATKLIEPRNEKWLVGIDFGTTNTSTYFTNNGGEPRELAFSNRVLRSFVGQREDVAEAIHKDFFALVEIPAPFMTILRDRQLPDRHLKRLPIWDEHIYFVGDILTALTEIVDDDNNRLSFDLKWQNDPSGREKVKLYLAQVVLQCLAEAVSRGAKPENMDWRVSYPEAFKADHLRSFFANFASAIKLVMTRGAVTGAFDEKKQFSHSTESLATALYFHKKHGAALTENTISIDIGGHTSDISIWQSDSLIWRNSIEIAGRHVLIDFLTNHIGLLKVLAERNTCLAEGVGHLVELDELNSPKLPYAIEVLVNSDAFLEAFSENFALFDGLPEGALLRNMASVALGGVLQFVGDQIQWLTTEGYFSDNISKSVQICLGGRASLLFKMLQETEIHHPVDRGGVLDIFMDAAGGGIDTASFIFTDAPKHEVAYGLLVDPTDDMELDLISKRCENALIGEAVQVGEDSYPPETKVSNLDIHQTWRIGDMPNTDEFLKSVERNLNIRLKMDPAVKGNMIGAINTELGEARRRIMGMTLGNGDVENLESLEEGTMLEPLFVMVLRQLVTRINKGEIGVTSF